LTVPAFAQNAGSLEGRVTSSVDHAGLAGVDVTVGSQRTTTDGSGGFRVAGLTVGEQSCTFEAAGYFKNEIKVRVDSARLDIELTPYSSISGRLVDEEGRPLVGVRVEITQAVRGTGTTWYRWRALTDRNGRYRSEGLKPGTYLVMAQPDPAATGKDGEREALVRSYYPGASDRGQAGRLMLRGGTHLAAGYPCGEGGGVRDPRAGLRRPGQAG
jgi:hypothetical protein